MNAFCGPRNNWPMIRSFHHYLRYCEIHLIIMSALAPSTAAFLLPFCLTRLECNKRNYGRATTVAAGQKLAKEITATYRKLIELLLTMWPITNRSSAIVCCLFVVVIVVVPFSYISLFFLYLVYSVFRCCSFLFSCFVVFPFPLSLSICLYLFLCIFLTQMDGWM